MRYVAILSPDFPTNVLNRTMRSRSHGRVSSSRGELWGEPGLSRAGAPSSVPNWKRARGACVVWLVLLSANLLVPWGVAQVTVEALHSFGNPAGMGVHPRGQLIKASDGALYGTTYEVGLAGYGAVFKINEDGSGYTALHLFQDTRDGRYPYAGVAEGDDGALYGTTYAGGPVNRGTIFKVNKDGTGYAQLYTFKTSGGDGLDPRGWLVKGSDGALYGTTSNGGTGTRGTIYKINGDGSGYTNLYSFQSTGGDGRLSYAGLLVASNGVLYGTTYAGGTNDRGMIFGMNPDGSGYTNLHSFQASAEDGQYPWAGLIEGTDGALYGTTSKGGSADRGTVFKISKDGNGYAVLYSFQSSGGDGSNPYAGLVGGAGGTLLGTTYGGGTNGSGSVFRIQENGDNYTNLCSFASSGGGGTTPYAGLTKGTGGMLFGVCHNGGSGSYGTVFQIAQDGGGYSTLYRFLAGGGDGQNPYAGLTEGKDGWLYGTTYSGGNGGFGSVFRLGKNGSSYTLLHSFQNGTADGASPWSRVVDGGDEALYGTTYSGGTDGRGTVYKLNKNGSGFTLLHSFQLANDGFYPWAGLLEASNKAFYGVTSRGGSSDKGTIFRIQKDGNGYTNLYSFQASGGDGQTPQGNLMQGSDGMLYGTTQAGGASGLGTVFRIGMDGNNYAKLYSFRSSGNDGQIPYAGVLEGIDGALYGTTWSGGTNSRGSLWKLLKDGSSYWPLYSFMSTGNDGQTPWAALVRGSDGLLYGTTQKGGTNGVGTLFRISEAGGSYSNLYSFRTLTGWGQSPISPLCAGSDGSLYGTTAGGGVYTYGLIFKLVFPRAFRVSVITTLPGGNQRLTLAGNPGQAYAVQASDNLSVPSWTNLAGSTTSAPPSGTWLFDDLEASNHPSRFYRGIQQ